MYDNLDIKESSIDNEVLADVEILLKAYDPNFLGEIANKTREDVAQVFQKTVETSFKMAKRVMEEDKSSKDLTQYVHRLLLSFWHLNLHAKLARYTQCSPKFDLIQERSSSMSKGIFIVKKLSFMLYKLCINPLWEVMTNSGRNPLTILNNLYIELFELQPKRVLQYQVLSSQIFELLGSSTLTPERSQDLNLVIGELYDVILSARKKTDQQRYGNAHKFFPDRYLDRSIIQTLKVVIGVNGIISICGASLVNLKRGADVYRRAYESKTVRARKLQAAHNMLLAKEKLMLCILANVDICENQQLGNAGYEELLSLYKGQLQQLDKMESQPLIHYKMEKARFMEMILVKSEAKLLNARATYPYTTEDAKQRLAKVGPGVVEYTTEEKQELERITKALAVSEISKNLRKTLKLYRDSILHIQPAYGGIPEKVCCEQTPTTSKVCLEGLDVALYPGFTEKMLIRECNRPFSSIESTHCTLDEVMYQGGGDLEGQTKNYMEEYGIPIINQEEVDFKAEDFIFLVKVDNDEVHISIQGYNFGFIPSCFKSCVEELKTEAITIKTAIQEQLDVRKDLRKQIIRIDERMSEENSHPGLKELAQKKLDLIAKSSKQRNIIKALQEKLYTIPLEHTMPECILLAVPLKENPLPTLTMATLEQKSPNFLSAVHI